MNFQQVQSELEAMPIKDRMRWYQDKAEKGGHTLTRKQAKEIVNTERCTMFQNDEYTVLIYDGREADHVIHVPEMKGKCGYISFRRNDREPITNWEDAFAIKEYFYPGREAMEIYPAPKRLVNAANQYHLIVMPEGVMIPFGFAR